MRHSFANRLIRGSRVVLTGVGACAIVACSDSPSSTPSSPDAGTVDDASPNDACHAGLPPSGFATLAEGDPVGVNADIVLTAGDAPVVAYTAPKGDRLGIYMARWDAACAVWQAPVEVDTTALQTSGTSRQLALAFDASTGAVGIVYQEITAPLGQNEDYQIRYASLAKGASAASPPERVDVPSGASDVDQPRSAPGLAMSGGNVYVAWHQLYRKCGISGCDGIVYRTKSGGAWSAESVAPTAANMYPLAQSTAVAVDATGAPAVAFLAANHTGADRTEIDFWRPGAAASNVVMGSDVGTDAPNVALAFAGTKPRIAAAIHLTPTWASDGETTWFAASDDGVTWSSPVAIPRDPGAGFGSFVALAVTGERSAAVLADVGSGDGTDTFGTPKIARTTDLTTFTTAGPPKTAFTGASPWLRAAAGADGKLQVVFFNPPGSATLKTGFVYYRE